MSTLKVNKLRDTAGSADAITLDPNGGAVLAGVTTMTTARVTSGIVTNTFIVGAGVTISESGIEASGIGITCANINGAQIAGRRNMIINGAMQVAQRGTTSTDSGYKTIDRWDTTKSGMDQLALTQKQVSDSPNEGYSYSYEVDITTAETAQAGDEYLRVQHIVEAQDLQHLAYGTSSAKSTTLSFWVKAKQTGTYAVNFYSSDGTRHISRTYTISAEATWEHKTVTIPGDTSGTINNDTGSGIHIAFLLIADSGYVSSDSTSWGSYSDAGYAYGQAVNVASSTDNYWKISGVQLEIGSVATDFEHRSFAQELFLCQRYCQVQGASNGTYDTMATGNAQSNTNFAYVPHRLVTTMRSTPSFTLLGSASDFMYTRNNGDHTPSAIVFDQAGKNMVAVKMTGASFTTDAAVRLFNVNTTGGYLFTAEL